MDANYIESEEFRTSGYAANAVNGSGKETLDPDGMSSVSFAHLSDDTVHQIRQFEAALRAQTHQDIVLLAYEKDDDEVIPRH